MGTKEKYNHESRNEPMKSSTSFYRRGNEVKSKGLLKVKRILEQPRTGSQVFYIKSRTLFNLNHSTIWGQLN